MKRQYLAWVAATAFLAASMPATAHHSFAAFFDPSKTVSVTGKVTEFRFTNPHGTITLEVKSKDGKVEIWRAETNAPVVLQRRGWNRTIIKPGQVITISGWPARDGKPYIRLQTATDANGKLIGTAPFRVLED